MTAGIHPLVALLARLIVEESAREQNTLREAEREYLERMAAQAENPSELERIRGKYASTPRVY